MKTIWMKIAASVLIAGTGVVCGQSFPQKPIRLVVPFPPGGVDPVARVVAQKMSEALGQPVVLENRAGANGMIGSDHVAKAPGDGYTLLFGTSSTHVTPTFLSKNLPYDPINDFTPISLVAEVPNFVVVAANVPAKNMAELLSYAKANPARLSYASTGVGSLFHLMGEQIKQAAGVDILHVPYKGTGPALQDLIAGRVSMYFIGTLIGDHVRAGKLRVIATLDDQPSRLWPDSPAITTTLPNYKKIGSWLAFYGPARMPQSISSRLTGETVKAAQSQEARPKIEEIGWTVLAQGADALAARMKIDLRVFKDVATAAKIEPE